LRVTSRGGTARPRSDGPIEKPARWPHLDNRRSGVSREESRCDHESSALRKASRIAKPRELQHESPGSAGKPHHCIRGAPDRSHERRDEGPAAGLGGCRLPPPPIGPIPTKPVKTKRVVKKHRRVPSPMSLHDSLNSRLNFVQPFKVVCSQP
jgi:hypothetical protein